MKQLLKSEFFLLISLFLISVAIRIPNLDRPVSKHHEFNTAFFLIPMEIWNEEGISKHGFLPPYNYYNDNDKYIEEPISIPHGNKNGTYYYLSFPSLSYVAPYVLFQTLQIDPSPLSLQLFNLALHFLLCWLLYKILRKFFLPIHTFIGVSLYLFSPGTLWFHGNGYTHHIFATFLLVCTLYFLIRIVVDQKDNLQSYLLFSGSLFLLLLSEWIGVVFIVALCSAFLLFKNLRVHWKVLPISIATGTLAGGLLIYQYSTFIGWEQYIAYQMDRFAYRSTLINDTYSILDQLFAWAKWSFVSYSAWLILIITLAVLLILRRKRPRNKVNPALKALLFITATMILSYHFLFMEFTLSHDYSVIYDGLFWALSISTLTWMVNLNRKWVTPIITVVFVLGTAQYYYINRPGSMGQNGDRYSIYKDIGERIKRTSSPDETIFISGFNQSVDPNNPQIMYYAKRNFKPVASIEEAEEFLREHHRNSGRLYILNNGQLTEMIIIKL